MTERDFAYWLQGFFEIGKEGEVWSDLTPEQIDCIKNHIALVRTTQKTSVLLTAIEALLDHDTVSVQKVISSYFEHVIDPQHPDQDVANAAHTGFKPAFNHPASGPKVRC
jgi:hypothetical protein